MIVTDDDNENIDNNTVILISSMTDTAWLYTPSDYVTILKVSTNFSVHNKFTLCMHKPQSYGNY